MFAIMKVEGLSLSFGYGRGKGTVEYRDDDEFCGWRGTWTFVQNRQGATVDGEFTLTVEYGDRFHGQCTLIA